MPGLLDLPLEIRNTVYDLLLHDALEPQSRGVMVVSEPYVKNHLPLRCYRGLLRACRQLHHEFKQAIRHMAAAKQLVYELDVTFSHGRPFFSLTWVWFPGLSQTINSMIINVDLRVREPFDLGVFDQPIPHEHELAHLLEDAPESFAEQLFDYVAILLKALANLLGNGDRSFNVLYTETMILNCRMPTKLVPGPPRSVYMRRVPVDREEADKLFDTMRNTLKANAKAFQGFDAVGCGKLSPLIQIGSLRFATEGRVWGEGHNLILAHDDFQWLRY
ncbi:hypothetical protein BU26DRAFT_322736 [Trematosphaeria pertusa]|uniref:Uncharacterized protein n=1 Tax=Trematosphaeria pertusa TaxID=390896 RepID=A0A6A6IBZ5_9PLEO|nr:uncharacterized protein BU26DRAFT_322736 [Trematosphaeria pertusa]KAF2247901.1 hypothetical protein BU26DRAFT_322736 [Trematosphaeria pertusa]